MEEIENNINPQKKNIQLAMRPKSNKTIVMHFKSTDDREKMKEIDKLEHENTETNISEKLLSTIKIHGIGDTTKEEIAEYILSIAGDRSSLISINKNAEPNHRKAFVTQFLRDNFLSGILVAL